MINAMLPEQISAFWDVIKYGIEQSHPPTTGDHPDKMNRILSALLIGMLMCWAGYERGEKANRFEGIMVTDIVYDGGSDTRSLLIYSVFGYDSISAKTWQEGLQVLVKYARSKKCSKIIAYTKIPHMVKVTNQLGGDASWTFCSFDVKGLEEKFL